MTVNDCVYSYGEPTAPWGGFKHSGIGRTHGRAGLREMAQVKYVSRDTVRRPALWWFPYDRELAGVAATANTALHARSFWRRMVGQLKLFSFRRFRQRGNIPGIIANIDKAL